MFIKKIKHNYLMGNVSFPFFDERIWMAEVPR